MARLLRCWYIKLLFLLLALFCVFVKHFTEVFPSALRDKNRVSKVALNLTNGDVSTYKKEKVFIQQQIETLLVYNHETLPWAFFLHEKKKFLFSILTWRDCGACAAVSASPSSYSSMSSLRWLLNSSMPSAGMKI